MHAGFSLLLVYLAFEQVARLLIMRLASDDDGPGSGRSGKARRKTHKGFPVTRWGDQPPAKSGGRETYYPPPLIGVDHVRG